MSRAPITPGDTLYLQHQLLLLCVLRPMVMPTCRGVTIPGMDSFGEPDPWGMVGESPALWRVRDAIGLVGVADDHVLVTGESGTGKELTARGLHASSKRKKRPFVARNAATLPEGLMDAEMFGNIKGYPNPGTPERPGLVGSAHTGTLFLDEIGELPEALQAHLLRVIDTGGEYHRLGESNTRRADIRLVAATNRPITHLKHDLAARLTSRLALPGLGSRRDDIPLLAYYLLRTFIAQSPEVGARYLDRQGQPRLDGAFMDALLRHHYTHHVRELGRLLRTSMTESTQDYLELTDKVTSELVLNAPEDHAQTGLAEAETELDPTAVQQALDRCDGNITQAAHYLGLKNRYVLYRLIKKLGL